ncbi:hypothetical protein SCHPADRAFT_940299 [Schizopora paradoxa]|uniref:RRM domain-containing protein n=1 Tax=Schizopora paradoxa TaxID=27342 RepID=A0A0H2RPK0_9AGAM|nr:hypothetical protein SCHPADRAFT_940299 [Schizopora paradoxa]
MTSTFASVAELTRRQASRSAAVVARVGTKRHVLLNNVPKTATPADVLRMARQCRVENCIGASLDYHYFEPRGQAFLEFSKPDFVLDALKTLEKTSISGSSLKPYPYDARPIQRSRGKDGREEASDRGLLKGDGPAAGIPTSGREVIIIGIPSRTSPEELKAYLVENKLVEEGLDGKGMCEVLSTEAPNNGSSQKARTRMYVRMKSVTAAHELAKRLNMTYYQPFVFRSRMLIKARVLY